MVLYPSHNGRLVPLEQMAEPHLKAALAKLQAQELRLARMMAGIDPDGAKAFKKAMSEWAPAFTLGEMLERTRTWSELLSKELKNREKIRWPEVDL